YQSELDALNEKYGEELKNTKEYEEALTLLKELYAEKRKKILEDEKKAQEDSWGTGAAPEEQKASAPSGAASFDPNAPLESAGSGFGRPGDIADRVKNSVFGGIMDAVTSRIQDVVTSVNQAIGTINGALPKDMTVEKNFKFESSFSIPSLDKESTRRWVRETLGPELDEYYRLRGVKL
ncbi:MAG: hypothetical protein M0Z60_02425, partial [Nitrospiraceae bacterium]|nr:hypothetical protein [Nitrospiraceae bacterium]